MTKKALLREFYRHSIDEDIYIKYPIYEDLNLEVKYGRLLLPKDERISYKVPAKLERFISLIRSLSSMQRINLKKELENILDKIIIQNFKRLRKIKGIAIDENDMIHSVTFNILILPKTGIVTIGHSLTPLEFKHVYLNKEEVEKLKDELIISLH